MVMLLIMDNGLTIDDILLHTILLDLKCMVMLLIMDNGLTIDDILLHTILLDLKCMVMLLIMDNGITIDDTIITIAANLIANVYLYWLLNM